MKYLFLLLSFFCISNTHCQNYLDESLIAGVVKSYKSHNFTGVRVFQKDSISQFLVVCVQLEKGKFDLDTRNTIAEARAKKSAISFINGDYVNCETLFVIDEYSNSSKSQFYEEYFSERLRIFTNGIVRNIQNIYFSDEGSYCTYLFFIGQ